jgi:hypothetical protein
MKRMGSWRRLVVCLAAFAFACQVIGLFAAAPRAVTAGPSVERAAAIAMADCPHHHGKGPAHHDDAGGCPMCQAIGCALAGAPAIDMVALPDERLIGILSVSVAIFPSREKLSLAANPRGPPALL